MLRSDREPARVLLIESPQTGGPDLRALLDSWGQDTARASCAAEAMDLLGAEEFAVVVVGGPPAVAMESARQVRVCQRSRRTPVVVVTVEEPSSDWLVRAYRLGAVDCIGPSAIAEVLRAKVEGLVGLAADSPWLDEVAWRLSEERFRAIFEQSPLSTQILATDGRTVAVNRAWEELWGGGLEDLDDYNVLEDPQLAAKGILPYIHRGFAGEATAIPAVQYNPNETLPDRSRHSDPRRWVRAFIYPIRDGGGRLREVVLVHEDITARRRAEEALAASDREFRVLFELAPVGVAQAEVPSGRFIRVNRRYCQITGYSESELLEKTFIEITHPDDRSRDRESVLRAMRGEVETWELEKRYVRPDGRIAWVVLCGRIVRGPDGQPPRSLVSVLDVTERKWAERELERYRLLAQHASDIVLFIRPAGRIVEANAAAVAAYGYDHPTLTGLNILDLRDPATAGMVPQQMFEADEAGIAFETWHRRKDGSIFPVEVSARGAEVAGERLILSLIRDITKRREAQEALKEADRRKDEFLAVLAHELRNPLAPIRNAVQVMKLIGPGDADLCQARDVIDRQVAHLARLVDDLLDVSRISRGKVLLRAERLDLMPLVRAAVGDHRPLLESTGLRLVVDLPDRPIWVQGDPTRLLQVAGNLLQNARKFTDPGGTVTVRLAAEPDGAAAILAVRDTGIGMDDAMLARLFEPFTQADRSLDRSRGGLGLGLALVKGLVELHGGSVRAQSDGPGSGSELTVRLPTAVPAEPRADRADGPIASGRSLRVLVIEDHQDSAESLRMLLRLYGHRVEIARTGLDGVEAARAFRPDVVLCDIGLPGGMDGYAVARALRSDSNQAAVLIALSGYGQDDDRRQSRQAGFDRHLTKPVDPVVLKQLIDALADGAAP
jgi:PAS domain S-box-containing protein